MDCEKLIEEKADQYGSPEGNFGCIDALEDVFFQYYPSHGDFMVRQPMRGIFRKIARVATGKNSPEHWKDIMGYAQIALTHAEKFGVE